MLYEYINSLGNDVCNLFVNMSERIKIYREFYHCIIYIANDRINNNLYYGTLIFIVVKILCNR